MKYEEKDIDALTAFIEFIKNNKDISEPVSQYISHFTNVYKIESLFNDDEKIITDADEAPTHDERVWWYNGHSTYTFFYTLLDNNQLLVVSVEKELEFFDPVKLCFHLYPNADELSVYLLPGHDKKPYFNIIDKKGKRINRFSFERIHDYSEYAYGIQLKDLVFPVSRYELEERIEKGKRKIR